MDIRKGWVIVASVTMALMSGCAATPAKRSPVSNVNADAVAGRTGGNNNVTGAKEAGVERGNSQTRDTLPTAVVSDKTIAPEPQPVKKDRTRTALEAIYFGTDSYLLGDDARSALVRDGKLMEKSGPDAFILEGHCDERGDDDYNLALGEKRANAVRQYLEWLGIPGRKMRVISYGNSRPVDRGHDEAAWTKNRRVEIVDGNL